MAVDTNFYTGPYIELEVEPTVSIEKINICSKHLTTKSSNPKKHYCSICGEKLVENKLKKSVIPNLYDLLDEEKYLDVLLDTNFNQYDEKNKNKLIIIGNDGIGWIDYNDFISLTAEELEMQVINFKKEYKEEIEILKTKSKSLSVKFGAFIWYS